MKKLILTAAFAALAVCANVSCDRQDEISSNQTVGEESLHIVNPDDIHWAIWDTASVFQSKEKMMEMLWYQWGDVVFLITHPDSAGVGIIRCDNPSAQVFRVHFGMEGSRDTKVIPFVTKSEAERDEWRKQKEGEGYVIVSYEDKDGFFYAMAYTKKEWEEMTGQQIE